MNIEPCVRLGMRISPKIREKPADNRNSSPPNVTLLTVSRTQNVMAAADQMTDDRRRRTEGALLTRRLFRRPSSVVRPLSPVLCRPSSAFSALRQRRIVARVDRVREKFLFRPSPELADVLVGLDGLVPELEAVFGPLGSDAPNVERADDVAEMIELDRAARRVGQIDRFQDGHELFLVGGVSARRFETGIDHLAVHVKPRRVETRNDVEILQYAVDEPLVAIGFEVERIRGARDEADRLLAVTLEQRIVAAGRARHHRVFETGVGIRLHEAQGVRAGKALADAIAIADLRDVGCVVGGHDRRPQLVDDAAALFLESGLEAAHLLVAKGEIPGDAKRAV